MDHLKGAYRRFGPSLCSWIASVGQPFDAGRPPPSRSIHILPYHGSDGNHFSRSMPEVAARSGIQASHRRDESLVMRDDAQVLLRFLGLR
jgi:hypothetical protein